MSNVNMTTSAETHPLHYRGWSIPPLAKISITVDMPRQITYGETMLLLDEAARKMRAELAEYFARTSIDTGRRT